MTTTVTAADDFISRWQDKDGTEKAKFQLFITHRGCFVPEGKQSNKELDSGGWDKAAKEESLSRTD